VALDWDVDEKITAYGDRLHVALGKLANAVRLREMADLEVGATGRKDTK
jgi:hypothetical protein